MNTFTARAGCESRRPHGSLRPAPCEPPAPGQNRPAGPRAALSRAVAAARHAAAVFLVVVAGLLAVSTAAQAQQTTTTFVYTSNSNQSWSGAADGFQAQSVMTGPNSAGYLITQVRLDVDDINTAGLSTVVKIRENSASDEPGNLVATLTHSGNLISSAFNTFTVPSNTRLDPNTTYWITVNEGVASDRVSFSRTRGHGEFSFPDTGWRIGDSRLYRSSEMDDWSSSAAPFLLEVRGPPHVSVAIEPNQPSIVAGSEDLVFTLTRVAAQPDELEAKVTIVQDQSWLGTSDLEHTVTFTRFVATASLTLNASSFSSDPDTAGDLTATVSGDRILGGSTTVEVTVDDDETASAKLTLSVDPPSVSEDAVETEVTVTGTLDGAPLTSATEVAVTVGVSGDTATEGMDYATVGELTLTIEAGATEGTTTFALTPTDDAVDEDDAETLSVTGTTAASGLEVVPTAVTIADDDARGVTVSAATLTVPEEGSNTYTVVLRSAPTADVTVTPSLSTGSSPEVSVSPVTLTFTPGNWATAQTVTVEADQDDDAEDDEATVEHEVSGGDYGSNGVTAADVAVTVDDDETASAKLTLSVDPPSVSEDAVETEVTVTGTLDGAPLTSATEVAVTVGVSGDTATEGMDYATVGELTLTIEAGATEGTTTFALTPTDDAVDEDDAETLSVTGTTAASGLEVVPTAVTIADDDARGVTVSAATLTVPEEGSNTYTVVLRSAPTADVTVTPSLSTGSSPEVSVSPVTLTFTPGNWATAQTVTVEADQDDDAEDDEATVEHEVSGGDYGSNGVTAADVAVTVDDDETASAKLTLSVDPPSVSEDAVETEVTVTGTLDGAPLTSATEVAVTVGVSGDTATEGMDYATVGELTLTIEAGATEGTTTFALTPTDDAVDEDDAETLSVTGTTAASGLEVVPTAVTIADDDARGVTVSAATLTVPEEGSNTYTVVLRSAPTADVTVTPSLSTGSSPEVSVSPVTLTFTPGNWATAQTVTVEADQDDDAEDDEATVEHEVSGGDYGSNGVTAADVAVTVDDDETASAKLTLSVDPPSVSEDAVETEVTVTGTLDGAPLTSATEVAVTVGVSGDTATEGMDYATVGELTLTIEAGATEGTTTFALTPTDDAVDEDDAETLSVTGTTAASGLEVVPTAVTIADDDARGVTVSAATLTVPEEGSNTYTVVLRSAPTADVTVTPSLSTGSSPEVSVSPVTLTFTPGNWATAQTVTVEADQDDDAEDDEATVEHEVSGGDYGSNGVTAADVAVTVDDDETASAKLTLSVDPPSVSEDAVETEVTVTGTLDGAPLTSATEVAVTVGVSGDTATEGMDYATVGELTLTIEAGATEGTTTFALTPTDDAVDEDDAETLSVTGTTAASGLEVVPTAVTIADDDARGVTVSAATLTVPEEGSNTYTVVLRSAPTADVTVTPSLSTGSSPEVSVSPVTLTFTPGNWATAQTVTVEADQDDDAEDDEATVEHEVSGGDYGSNGVTAADVAVTVDDDETASAKLTLSVDPPSVSEDAVETEVTVTGTLDGAPLTSATEVAVTVGVSGDTATEGMDYATVGELTLTIEAGATEGTTTFALTPTDDAVDEDDAETLSVTGTTAASGLEVVPTAVTIADDDARGVTVSAATLTVPEEGSNTYTVVLRSAPTADVTVTPSLSTGSSPEVSVSPATLTFTPGNWATAQTVTVEADQDDDAEDDEATVEHEVSGGDYGSNGVTAADVAVTVDDDETEACVLGTDVWCATLTVKNLGSGNRGCANSQSGNECSNTSHLTEDEFTHDMTDYTVTSVQVRTNEELRLWISRNLSAPTGSLVLVVGSERFSLARADTINDNNRRWDSSRLSWSTGDTVELRLVEGFPPLAPAAPRVNGIGDNDTSLKVTWGEPNNAGRPPITHYDLRYRETGSGSWQSGPQGETGPNATIGSLTTGAEYDVQVRASNADGNGEWSPSGQGTPGVVEETIPNGKLQLVDKNGVDVTNTTGIGRLEVRLKGEWGTVCEDRFDSETFTIYGPNFFNGDRDDKQTVDNIAPELACQLMGKATGEMVTRPGNISIAPESQKIWLDDVRCAAGSTPESTPGLQHCYHAGVGLHNCRKDHMREDVHLQCTGTLNPESATQEEEAAPLTASFEGLPETHDGATAFTFRLVLSADIANGDGDVRDSAFQVTGGTVTGASRVDGRSDLWEITVTPDGTGNIGIVLMADRECGTAGALCTGDGRALTTALLVTVAEQPGTSTATTSADEEGAAPLTAQFVDVPAEHDGENEFSVELRFSEPPAGPGWYGARNIAVKRAIDISGGTVVSARSIEQNGAHRRIVVQPSGNGPVTLSLPPGGPACDQAGALCTEAGGRLETGALTRIRGPAALSVADAEVQEGPGAALAFSVTLDRATSAAVQVDYATRDGTAQAGSDYTANSGTLNFAPGETAKTVTVAVLDDSHDEGSETLTLVLSNPSGAYLADGEAVGTIENSDLMPQAWLSRFGRTVAEQVLEAVEERIRSAPQAGVQVTVAGQRIGTAAASDADVLEETEAQARLEDFSTWLAGEAEARESRTGSRSVAPRELLTGSSFALTTRADGIGGGLVSLWGRGALTRFDGREDELSLSGEVTGALLGADWTRDPGSGSGAGGWTMGLMLSHARGEGSYRGANSGKVSSTVTGLYPYGRYALTDRVTVWGSAGYGAGALMLTPEDGEALKTDMDLMMAAAGLRGTVVEAPPEGGPELVVKTDAMAVRTSSEATGGGAGGNLAAAEADVTRLRLGLEGTWRGLEIGTGTLVPRLELGVRHDGGDAETGFGLDLGGGLAWSDPGTGIGAEVSARGLLTHESAGFRERGIAGRLGWDPTPGSDRGPSLTLSQTMGLSARGGADALLGRTTLAGLAANDNGDELERRRLELKLGYGFGAFGDRFTSTPKVGFGMSEGHRDYSLAWRLARDRRRGDIGSLKFSLDVRRRESANDDAEPEHTVGLRLMARW